MYFKDFQENYFEHMNNPNPVWYLLDEECGLWFTESVDLDIWHYDFVYRQNSIYAKFPSYCLFGEKTNEKVWGITNLIHVYSLTGPFFIDPDYTTNFQGDILYTVTYNLDHCTQKLAIGTIMILGDYSSFDLLKQSMSKYCSGEPSYMILYIDNIRKSCKQTNTLHKLINKEECSF